LLSTFARFKESRKLNINIKDSDHLAQTADQMKSHVQPSDRAVNAQLLQLKPGSKDFIKRNKSMDFKINLPKIVYADESVHFGDQDKKSPGTDIVSCHINRPRTLAGYSKDSKSRTSQRRSL